MASRDAIVAHLDELLDAAGFDDYTPNGLQVPGAAEVDMVVTGVSPGVELFERAAELGAQMVICHHGLLGDFHPDTITPLLKRRIAALLDADLSLAAYHLPLDAHAEVGNNALICEQLGLAKAERFGSHRGRPLGFVARSERGIQLSELRERCATAFGTEPFVWPYGPDPVHSIGVVSGAAASSLGEAVAAGLDAFLTGEPAEHTMLEARESGIHFLAGGHYATETFGVRRLGELLAHEHGVEHRFVDVPNPI
ncbi:MAG: Nif3-like dinuclear metal center hexameric protein [Thermoleophilaceae bacterium]